MPTPTRAASAAVLCLLSSLSLGCNKHDLVCNAVADMVGTHAGYNVPGEAGDGRFGMPIDSSETLHVRRSWSSLSDEEKREVLDGFIALKQITVDSGDAGSARADYQSLCDEPGKTPYTKNLYDFYVEAHANAFVSMGTEWQTMDQMAHQGPQFTVWHRYLLLRMEADLREVTGNPDFALPYWDWTDCWADGDPDACEPIFQEDFLGSGGSCDDDDKEISGYLTDQGFRVHITTNDESAFSLDSIVCETRPVKRAVACSKYVDGPPDQEEISGIFSRTLYDDAPYDSCETDEEVSFRQYLEGFSSRSKKPTCTAFGCGMHGRGHFYVGGDMDGSSASPNDPIFFMHHAQVDRMWAAWQDANRESGDASREVDYGNPGYPDENRVAIYNFPQISADELFDYRALGYEYDTLPSPE